MQPTFTTYENRSKAKLIATILTIVVVAGVVLVVDHLKSERTEAATAQQSPTTSQVSVTPTTSSTTTQSTASTSSYKDGTYTDSSSYFVPPGNENIKVTLTLTNGVITGSTITNSEGDPTSAAYQQDFASVYKSYVVGKQIADVRLGVIAGASDTTRGFEAALSQIASQAQA